MEKYKALMSLSQTLKMTAKTQVIWPVPKIYPVIKKNATFISSNYE